MNFKKEEAVSIAVQCAQLYSKNINNKDFLFVCGTLDNPTLLRTTFGPRNYLHLTGILPTKNSRLNPLRFFDACMTNHLSPDDIILAKDGTTEMKLRVLPYLMDIPKLARMAGDFSAYGIKLYTEKILGKVYGCMGFVISGERYVPNTALNYDVRDITQNRQRILAVFGKKTSEKLYRELCYLAKGVKLEDIRIPNVVISKEN